MVFQQKLLEKAYFIIKLTGQAMVSPVSSDKWKALLVTGKYQSVNASAVDFNTIIKEFPLVLSVRGPEDLQSQEIENPFCF